MVTKINTFIDYSFGIYFSISFDVIFPIVATFCPIKLNRKLFNFFGGHALVITYLKINIHG